ncbi:MAG: hypothetical protein HFH88_00090 [Lachnospiraceae bacterium]|nr:hypothetical protein [Lachnospiraceae bacterium]
MVESTLRETFDILTRLTLKNQAYFMTLLRVAQIAEDGVKSTLVIDSSEQHDSTLCATLPPPAKFL